MKPWFIALCCLLASMSLAAGRIDIAAWSHTAPVTVEGAPQKGVAEFNLSPEAMNLARPDLADLRLTTAGGEEVAYVVRPSGETAGAVLTGGRLYNRVFLPNKQSSVTVDFGGPSLKNRLQIDTSGDNFCRLVRVESSDDARHWQIIRNDGTLIRVTEGQTVTYNKPIVTIPDNDQRYLRITIMNGTADTGKIEIASVKVWKYLPTVKQTTPVPTLASTRGEVEKDGTTIITLDLGFRNLPLWQVTLSPSDASFYRAVTIYGRDAEQREIAVSVEDARVQKTVVAESWHEIARGVIFRYPGSAGRGESRSINLDGAKFRYLQLIIENGNNAPLHQIETAVTRVLTAVDFQPESGTAYRLYVGNATASPPSYDIARYLDALRHEGVASAGLGPVTGNPAFKSPVTVVPWSERHPVILWITLLAVFGILLLLIIRQLGTMKNAGSEKEPEG
ncbi:MAG TPA: DUF3999 family protein [Armatimonadota bacterium]